MVTKYGEDMGRQAMVTKYGGDMGRKAMATVLQVLEELRQAASSARRPGTVWMLTATSQHLKELDGMQSPAHRTLLKWQQTKRFQMLDPGLATQDLVLNAVRFCRLD